MITNIFYDLFQSLKVGLRIDCGVGMERLLHNENMVFNLGKTHARALNSLQLD